MAGRDNVIFSATVASGITAGTVVPLSLLYGIENVRQGYGTARLKNVRAVYSGGYAAGTTIGIPIEIKNSNWIDSAGLNAVPVAHNIAFARDSLSFMRGRDKVLEPNTSWTINAKIMSNTTAAAKIYVILEIEYSDVPGYDAEEFKSGSPVMKQATNAAVTGAADVPVSIGTFDNLLQGTDYYLSEVSAWGLSDAACNFLIFEGFSNQRGLIRIFPIRNYGIAEQIDGSVKLTKQTYNLSIISAGAISGGVTVYMEMIANKN